MGLLSYLVVPLLAVLAFIFISMDADFATYFASHVPNDYYKDKVVWVTGASSGIGEYFAKEVAGRGAKVVLSARREPQLQHVQQSLGEGVDSMVLAFDMTNTTANEGAVQAVLHKYGKVDVLVLNAGQYQTGTVEETPPETLLKMVELNFLSSALLAQKVLPHMLARKSGHMVITTSFSGRVATPLSASYSASKYALHGYFDSLRAEVADKGITITTVCPGPVKSEIGAHAIVTNAGDGYDIQASDKRMPTERCAFLMASGVAHRIYELWICEQPVLILYYLAEYTPRIALAIGNALGPGRVRVFKKGGDDYDLGLVIKDFLTHRGD